MELVAAIYSECKVCGLYVQSIFCIKIVTRLIGLRYYEPNTYASFSLFSTIFVTQPSYQPNTKLMTIISANFQVGSIQLEKFQCRKCGRTYKYKSGLAQHIKFQCGIEKQFVCRFCGKSFNFKFQLKTHTGLIHKILL